MKSCGYLDRQSHRLFIRQIGQLQPGHRPPSRTRSRITSTRDRKSGADGQRRTDTQLAAHDLLARTADAVLRAAADCSHQIALIARAEFGTRTQQRRD